MHLKNTTSDNRVSNDSKLELSDLEVQLMNDMQIDRLRTLLDQRRHELNNYFARHAFSSNEKKGLSIDQDISLAEGSDTLGSINFDLPHDNVS